MTALKGTKTHENLKHAFGGESQANRRDLSFARRADIERFEHSKHFSPVSVARA